MTAIAIDNLLEHSVTRDEAALTRNGVEHGVYYVYVPALQSATGPLPPELSPIIGRERDRILTGTIFYEDMWAAAIGKAITKQAALGFTVKDSANSDLRVKRAQELLLNINGGSGWVAFLAQHLLDYFTTDNGAFVEVVRASSAQGSRILGLMHLDSLRCWRTGDPAYPVVYEDLLGQYHLLRDYQVLTFADMVSPRTQLRGMGMCAASRCYQTIYKLHKLETYFTEKIAGTRPLEIHLVNGISSDQMSNAVRAADNAQQAKGYTVYRGVVVIPAVKMDAQLTGYRIPLAEVPVGYDVEKERTNGYTKYANNLGISVTDLYPLTGQGLGGASTQAKQLAEAAEGVGDAAWRKDWEHKLNTFLLPASVTFMWSISDIADKKARADISKVHADTRAVQVKTGEITAPQALQMAVDAGDVPDSFVVDDETAQNELADTEKPVDEEEVAPVDVAPAVPTVPAPGQPVEKARKALVDQAAVLRAAAALYDEVTGSVTHR